MGKRNVTVLGGEEGLKCEVCIDGIHLEHVSEFKYLGCVLDKSGTDEAECSRKGVSGRRIVGPQKKWIDTLKDCLKKRFGCQASKENGAW